MKICTVCKEQKSLDEFYNSRTYKDGKSYRCKDCDSVARKEYEIRHKERRRENMRRANRKYKYGLTHDEFERLLHIQEYKCAICQTKMSEYAGGRPHDDQLCVDHDHKTGKVRGLLCHRCNRGIGMFKDSSIIIDMAIKYLERKY